MSTVPNDTKEFIQETLSLTPEEVNTYIEVGGKIASYCELIQEDQNLEQYPFTLEAAKTLINRMLSSQAYCKAHDVSLEGITMSILAKSLLEWSEDNNHKNNNHSIDSP